MAMPAEMTDRPHERSKLMSFRVVNGSLGNLVGGRATATLIALFGGGLVRHRAMGVIVGLAGVSSKLVLIPCSLHGFRATTDKQSEADMARALRETFAFFDETIGAVGH